MLALVVRGLGLLLILILLLLVLTPLAQAVQQHLAADVDKGITIWNRAVFLFKQGNGPHNTWLTIPVGSDDLRVIRSWPGEIVYVVVYVSSIDGFRNVPPKLQVFIATLEGSETGGTVYSTAFISITGPGVYTFAIPKDVFESPSLDAGFRVALHLGYEWWDTANGPDNRFGIMVRRVVLAPPKTSNPSPIYTPQPTHTIPQSGRASGDDGNNNGMHRLVLYAVAGGVALAILLLAAHVHGRGRRRGSMSPVAAAVVLLLALTAASISIAFIFKPEIATYVAAAAAALGIGILIALGPGLLKEAGRLLRGKH